MALAGDKLSTRNGPSTDYKETETYFVAGEYIRLISRCTDSNGVVWVQCDVPAGYNMRRVYTGLKRFQISNDDLARLPWEYPLYYKAKVIKTSTGMYGPGYGYGNYYMLTVDKGMTVTVIAIESDYVQVEWSPRAGTQKYTICRVWIPLDSIVIQ